MAEAVRKVRKRDLIQEELERIRLANGGYLSPKATEQAAKNPESILHPCFVWDDKRAGYLYRLDQAEKLIRSFTFPDENTGKEVRVYVSLVEDRNQEKGYRSMQDVLTSDDLRDKFLKQAFDEFDRWQIKYRDLSELVSVFGSMKKVKTKMKQ